MEWDSVVDERMMANEGQTHIRWLIFVRRVILLFENSIFKIFTVIVRFADVHFISFLRVQIFQPWNFEIFLWI